MNGKRAKPKSDGRRPVASPAAAELESGSGRWNQLLEYVRLLVSLIEAQPEPAAQNRSCCELALQEHPPWEPARWQRRLNFPVWICVMRATGVKNPALEERLLVSIAQRGIEEPLAGVQREQANVFLNGFKCYRCAHKLQLRIVPWPPWERTK
jgi:hypothetical protein